MNYLDIANSNFIYILGCIVFIFVVVQSVIFLILAWKEGEKIGIEKEKMKVALKSSITFSIVPTISILISLIALSPVLGVPFSWIRLSIVGSAPYELMAAEIGAQSMGVDKIGIKNYSAQTFANSMWVMSVGIIWGLLLAIMFNKKYSQRMDVVKKKDSKWANILSFSLVLGMTSAFVSQPIIQGGIALITLVTSALIMVLLGFIINRFKVNWLTNFALSISMISSMIVALLVS